MVTGENDTNPDTAVRVGSMVVIRGKESDVIGVVDSMELDAATFQRRVAVTPLGEITGSQGNGATFHRGVSHAPALGAFVVPATSDDLKSVYVRPSTSNVRIGTLSHDESQPAFVMVDELLSRHFAVVGASGSGKSCAVTLILSAILADQPNAHVILLDPHNEYTAAFGDLANVLNVDNLKFAALAFQSRRGDPNTSAGRNAPGARVSGTHSKGRDYQSAPPQRGRRPLCLGDYRGYANAVCHPRHPSLPQ